MKIRDWNFNCKKKKRKKLNVLTRFKSVYLKKKSNMK